MYLFYEEADIAIIEIPGALATCDIVKHNWCALARKSKPTIGPGPHWILQTLNKECIHFK
jgi:hypothetical protein